MNKIFLTLLFILFTSTAFGATIITGKWNRPAIAATITLYKVDNGENNEIASTKLSSDRSFAFAFFPEAEGFYVIGGSSNKNSPMDNYIFYLKDGDMLNLEVDQASYKLVGENTPENIEMEKWHNFMQPLETISSYFMKGGDFTYVDFFPLLEDKLLDIDSHKVANTSNELFNKRFTFYTNTNLAHEALMLINTPRAAHPQAEDFPDYYATLKIEEITQTDEILSYPYGMSLLNMYSLQNMKRMLNGSMPSSLFALIEKEVPTIIDPRTKGEVILYRAKLITNYSELVKIKESYGKYLVTDSQKKRLDDSILEAVDSAEGVEAFDFKGKDIKGKEIALSDLKGKIVYVDVWATWCGPCLKQAPHFKALAEKYKGNPNIVFLSASVDDKKDYSKWEKHVLADKTPNIHIFVGEGTAELNKAYRIKGIPRFMLFDKQGKIIMTDAPFPASEEIKPLLESVLKK